MSLQDLTPISCSPIWQALKHQVYLGEASFMEEVQEKMKVHGAEGADLKEIPRVQRRAIGRPLGWYEEHAGNREQGIVAAYLSGDYTMKEIADWFGVHYSTVSRAVRKNEKNRLMHDCKT